MTYSPTEAARMVAQLRLPNPISYASQALIADQLAAAGVEIDRLRLVVNATIHAREACKRQCDSTDPDANNGERAFEACELEDAAIETYLTSKP